MKNKILINKLKDNAELAMAAYGYFHLIGKKFKNDNTYKGREKTEITPTDILDITYQDYIAIKPNPHKPDDEIKVGKLDGDMTPTQAKRFFEKYDILIHQPNTHSGYSATLFQNKESKEYNLAIISTESKRAV